MPKELVVDDEADINQLLRDELEDRGYEVVEACNGKVGLKCAADEMPDIIFTDLYMPVMNGLEFIGRLKEIPSISKIPVVVVTVMNALATAKKAGELGVHHYLTKPWKPEEMDLVLEAVFKERDKVKSQMASSQSG